LSRFVLGCGWVRRLSGARPIGRDDTGDWYFHPREFNRLREQIERASAGRWEYSGGTDLVLVNGYLPDKGEPTLDWVSTIAGQVTDHARVREP
jgi:hypothetical protein